MDLSLSEDQQMVQQVFARFFEKESSPERVRKSEETGFDADLWNAVVATGLPTMGVAEDLGGGAATMIDLVLVARELGRRLAPVPLIEVLVAARLLSDSSADLAFVDQIAGGGLIPSIALHPVDSTDEIARIVPAGAIADLVIALHGDRLVAVRSAPGSDDSPPLNLGSAPLADRWVAGDAVEVTVLAEGHEATHRYVTALTEWKLLTAAALSGLQAQAQHIGVEYVKGREVFGAPLAWFQAVQHRFADLATEGLGAELLVLEAAWSHQADTARFPELTDMAFVFAADVASRTARESLQFHGGYGYTLEYDIQLYFRRAKAWPLALGPRRDVYESVAQRLVAAVTAPGDDA